MTTDGLDVFCLCAAWCRLCDDYRAVLDGVAASLAREGARLRWHWIDIEDQAAVVGDYDVETFPTLVLADGQGLQFAGPVTQQEATLRRLLRSALAGERLMSGGDDPGPARALVARLRRREV